MIDIQCNYCGKPFSIKMKNGVYSYTRMGATGKTYVAHILKKIGYNNVFVLEYTGDDKRLLSDIKTIQDNQYDLVYIDRADLIVDKALFYEFVEYSRNSTVVMDLKFLPKYMLKYTGVASIYYGEEGVMVT